MTSICIQITFLGEVGEDLGGPKREFWRLLSTDIQQTFFEGTMTRGIVRHDSVGLMVCSLIHVPAV